MDEMKDGQREHSMIDAHVHVYTDAIADRVTESLGERFGNPPAFTASVGGCRDFSDGSGVTVSLNLPVATTLDQVEKINAWALDVKPGGGRRIRRTSLRTFPRFLSPGRAGCANIRGCHCESWFRGSETPCGIPDVYA